MTTLELVEDRPPLPPADLILRVVQPFAADDVDAVRTSFDLDALSHLHGFERGLAAVGHTWTDFERLLDFGCGCGRFVRHFGQLAETVEIHGTDIDAEMIEWLREHIPYGHYEVAPHLPPLPYPEHHFDLVINHSVFTHLDEHMQMLWLKELQRVTRPDALLLLTVEGEATWNRMRESAQRAGDDSSRWQQQLETDGILFVSDDHFTGSTHPDFYHSAVHAPWYVFERWSEYFDVAAYLPEGSDTQDLIVLRRRADDAPRHQPIVARPFAAPKEPPPPRPLRERVERAAIETIERWAARRFTDPEPAEPSPAPVDPVALERQLKMLRAGLYEQGNRISVIAAQLRDRR